MARRLPNPALAAIMAKNRAKEEPNPENYHSKASYRRLGLAAPNLSGKQLRVPVVLPGFMEL
jgi:hypothetical protein